MGDGKDGQASDRLDACPVYFVAVDGHGRVLELNRPLAEVLGPHAAPGAELAELLLPEDERERIAGELASARARRAPFRFQSRMLATGAGDRVVEWHGGVSRTPQGEPDVVSLVGIDVTERVVAPGEHPGQEARMDQWRLIDAERLEAAGDLAASVAHAVNNPLAALLGTVEMAIEAARKPEPILERVQRLGQRIRTVVDRTLLLFRSDSLTFAPASAKQIVEDVCSELASEAVETVEISTRFDSTTPEILVDAKLLAAALVRIAENAIEASGGRGVEIAVSPLARVEGVRFDVLDRGPGFNEAHRTAAFEPFFTTRGRSTGLGLSIARGIVQGHGGRIQIGDRDGGGTVVSVEVPARPGAVRTGGATSAEAP